MKTYKFSLALGILVLLSSCSDYFELERPPQNPWNTVAEFERAPIGVYWSLFYGANFRIAYINWHTVISSMGDDVGLTSIKENTFGWDLKTEVLNAYTDRNIRNLYLAIGGCNKALDFVADKNGNPYPNETSTQNISDLNRIIGELYFLRGFSYYLLETTFGHAYIPNGDNSQPDIPYRVSFAKTRDEASKPKIGTTQEIWDLITADLKRAKQLLPEKYLSGMPSAYQTRANRFAASGMLMRSYFQKGSYDSAKMECDYIIDQNNGEYDLSEEPVQAFNKTSYGARGKEVIFYVAYDDPNNVIPGHLSHQNVYWADPGKEKATCFYVQNNLTLPTMQRLDWMDNPKQKDPIKLAARRDKRFTQLMKVLSPKGDAFNSIPYAGNSTATDSIKNNLSTVYSWKFFRGDGVKEVDKGFNVNTNLPVIRLAEVLLTRSIINFKKGNIAAAAADLNIVRKRAWDESVGGSYVPITSVTEQMINDERLIELFNEADRTIYLRGLKEPIPLGVRGPGSNDYTSDAFVWMIPNRETLYDESYNN